jgi:hypothetical protein
MGNDRTVIAHQSLRKCEAEGRAGVPERKKRLE